MNPEKTVALDLKDSMLKMKGQAVPLFSYHLLRDYILPSITNEYQGSILYWAGKDIAHVLQPNSKEGLVDLFLELGWGFLETEQDQKRMKTYKLYSPFFSVRDIEHNEPSFSLECGFLTECLAIMENKETEGEFKVMRNDSEPFVQFIIYLEDHAEAQAEFSNDNKETSS